MFIVTEYAALNKSDFMNHCVRMYRLTEFLFHRFTLSEVNMALFYSPTILTVSLMGASIKRKRKHVANIGITHVFSCINIAGSQGCCLNTRPIGLVFKHLPRDPASVNAMKQTCVIVILAYFTIFQPNSH